MKKVLHINSESSWRGGERQLFLLAKNTRTHGYHSVILCKKNSALEIRCKENGIPYYSAGFRSAFDTGTILRILRLIKTGEFDLVHLHTSKAHTLGVIAAILGAKLPFILSRRVYVPVKTNWLSQLKYNHSSIRKILTVSDAVKKLTKSGLQYPDRVVTVHSGIELEPFQNLSSRKVQSNDETLKIGWVGALTKEKDPIGFVYLAEKLLATDKKIQFVMVGKGTLEEKVRKVVVSEGLDSSFSFVESPDDSASLFASFDVFCHTAKTEGLGTAIIEASATGLPVVAFDVGGISEVVDHGESGFLIEVNDWEAYLEAADRLIKNQVLRYQFGERAKVKASNFGHREMVRRTVFFYNKVLAVNRSKKSS